METTAIPSSGSGSSATERFFRYFQHEITALQEQMSQLGDTALVGGERKDATDHCLAGITRLSTEVKDASNTLPSYDIKMYSDAIKALQDKLAETQAQFAPKPKFSFKTKKNASAVSIHDAAELAAQKQRSLLSENTTTSNASSFATTPVHLMTPPNELSASRETSQTQTAAEEPTTEQKLATIRERDQTSTAGLTMTQTTISVSSQKNSHIILPASTARAHTPCTLSNLRLCCVDLSVPTYESSPFASLMINNVSSSLLLCGSVAGPAHITGVTNASIVISCRQFRMHECENVDIYLYCTSRPIIEDCKGLRFAAMPAFYTDLLHSSTPTSNQAIGTNMWEHVDDFKWLRSEESPNWSVIPPEERVSEEDWKTLIPAKAGLNVDEILQIAQIQR